MTTTQNTANQDTDYAIDRVTELLSALVGRNSHPEDLEHAAIGIVHDANRGGDPEVLDAAGNAALRILADHVGALVKVSLAV